MATQFKFKKIIDVPVHEPLDLLVNSTNSILAHANGSSLIPDLSTSKYASKKMWFLYSATVLFEYDLNTNDVAQLASPALTGTFGAGAGGVFAPSLGPAGLLASGTSTTKFTLSTALPSTVSAMQLVGLRIRIIGNSGGGSGKTEERTIVSNSSGTTPVIVVDTALSFTPQANDNYEILSGRVFMLSAGTLAAGVWKYYDVATNSFSGNLATTNLPATISSDASFVALNELYTPISGYNNAAINGEPLGFFGIMTATGISSTTLTGMAGTFDFSVLANEWRNFQIRIVEDTATPTAVGQRRRITSHTAGASPVYTVPTWTVTPSATCKYVIENNNDIILWSSGVTTTYSYNPTTNAWSTSTYAARNAAHGAGCSSFQAFSGKYDLEKNFRYSNIYTFRGGAVATLEILDISAATAGVFTSLGVVYGNGGTNYLNTGSCGTYDPVINKFIFFGNSNSNARMALFIFDPNNLSLAGYGKTLIAGGLVTTGDKMGTAVFEDGTDKISYTYYILNTGNQFFRVLNFV